MEFLRKANPPSPLLLSPSSPSLACRPLQPPICSDSRPLPWGRQDLRVPASPAPPPRAAGSGPALTRPAIFADTSGSAAAAGRLVEPAPARARRPPSRRRAAAVRPRARPDASPASPAPQGARGSAAAEGRAGRRRHFEQELRVLVFYISAEHLSAGDCFFCESCHSWPFASGCVARPQMF